MGNTLPGAVGDSVICAFRDIDAAVGSAAGADDRLGYGLKTGAYSVAVGGGEFYEFWSVVMMAYIC